MGSVVKMSFYLVCSSDWWKFTESFDPMLKLYLKLNELREIGISETSLFFFNKLLMNFPSMFKLSYKKYDGLSLMIPNLGTFYVTC